MKDICTNVCYFYGEKEVIDELYNHFLDKNFSMNNLIPICSTSESIGNNLRSIMWGSIEDMKLLKVQKLKSKILGVHYTTDVPNVRYIQQVSNIFNVNARLCYIDDKSGYAGKCEYVKGKKVADKYHEDDNPCYDSYRKSIKEEQNILIKSNVKIISMKNILRKEE